jgi:hypothetical protein
VKSFSAIVAGCLVACAGDAGAPRPTGPVDNRERVEPAHAPALIEGGRYDIDFRLTEDTCGSMPATTAREVVIKKASRTGLVVRFESPPATWLCAVAASSVTCTGEDTLPTSTMDTRRRIRRESRLIPAADGFTGTFRSEKSCVGPGCGTTPADKGCFWVYRASARRRPSAD